MKSAPKALCGVAGLLMLLATPDCRQQQKITGAGNYCSDIDRIVWTSNREARPPQSGPPAESFNIFIMDGNGGHRARLTDDAWSTINQHPVFTPECQRIVWAHGDIDHSSIWIMNLDGSAKAQVAAPPSGEEDGHPWVGADDRIYFVRHQHRFGMHRIWRMNLNGSEQTEVIGSDDKDRFHPNLHRDKKLVLYTSGSKGDEIRVFNQEKKQDGMLYAPGWSVSAAIWRPDGKGAVVAEDRNRDHKYRIVEISYPGGTVIRTLTNDSKDNTIPYYAYPSGETIDYIQWSGERRTRNVARMNADGSRQPLLTNDAYENTKIIGEIELIPDPTARRGHRCVPRPVGCYPTLLPCEQFLLPEGIKADAEKLGRASAQAQVAAGKAQEVAADRYLKFTNKDLKAYIAGTQPGATDELRKRAQNLAEFLSGNTESDAQERVAEFYVNSYLAELNH